MDFSREEINKYSEKYDARHRGTSDELVERELRNWFLSHRYLDREHFIKLGLWKSKRQKRNYEHEENDELTVKEITKFALSTKSEKAKIKSLMVLKGVSWPVASVILHFAFPNQYPILDFRVIWSLKLKQPKNYNFNFWQEYTETLRKLAKKRRLSLRDIDKALWYYSKENQNKKSKT